MEDTVSLSSYKIIKDRHNKLGEIFNSIEMHKSKLYVPVLLMRRAIFVTLLITLQSIQSWILISLLSVLEIWYLISIIILRPFEEKKNNIIEITNEIFFLVLLSSLIFINTENDWNSKLIDIYMWIIMSNTFTVFIIIICKSYIITTIVDSMRTLVRLSKNKWAKSLKEGTLKISIFSNNFTYNLLF